MKLPASAQRWLVCLTPAFLLLLLDVELAGSWADRFFPVLRHGQEVLQRADWAAQDALWRLHPVSPPHPDLVYVAIDNTSLKLDQFGPEEIAASPELSLMQKGWPWHRGVYASVIERLLAAGAKAVVLDLLFLNPNPGDAALRETLDRHPHQVVIGANFGASEQGVGASVSLDLPNPDLIPPQTPVDLRVGYVNFWPDSDGVIRRVRYQARLGSSGERYESLMARTLRQLNLPERIPDEEELMRFRWSGGAGAGYPSLSFWQLADPASWQGNLKNGQFFAGKIVLIGPLGNWSQDEHQTPYGIIPGPEIHLTALAAALRGDFVREPNSWWRVAALLLAAAASLGLSLRLKKMGWRLVGLLAINAGILFLLWLLERCGWQAAVVSPLLAFNLGGLGALGLDFAQEQREKNRIRGTLEKYVSKNVVSQIIDHSEEFEQSLGGVRKPVTVLFSDVRGFTTIAETMDSHALVEQLNEYLTAMVRCVFAENGTLDKFIGDAVMAVWGNAQTLGASEDARAAVASALQMRRELERLNTAWRARGIQELHFGIGLNHGEVIVGNIGSLERKEFTVIGDAVNLASRLESLTKEYGLDLLLGESVAGLVAEHYALRLVDLVRVKGKKLPVRVYTVWQPRPDWAGVYEEGIGLYQAGNFAPAEEIFQGLIQRIPEDGLIQIYAQRLETLRAAPPEEWDGVYVMTKK